MRGIKINPADRTITEVDVPNPNKSRKGSTALSDATSSNSSNWTEA